MYLFYIEVLYSECRSVLYIVDRLIILVLFRYLVGCLTSICNKTLLLSDTNTAALQTLINNLQSNGFTVAYIPGGISNYTGYPDASLYGSIILITGTAWNTDMPISGQQSIMKAQKNNSTGVVMTEWGPYIISVNKWYTLSPLLLASHLNYTKGAMSHILVSSSHPIWNGLPTSFNTSVTVGYGKLGILTSGSIVIANCTVCGTPAVIVRPSSGTAGRVVQIAHAGHDPSLTTQFNWGNDQNLLKMTINAVKWAADLI